MGVAPPPHASDLDHPPLWCLSVPSFLLFVLPIILCCLLLRRCLLSLSGRIAVPFLASCSGGEGVVPLAALSFPSPPFHPVPVPFPSPSASYAPFPGLCMVWVCCGRAVIWPLCQPPPPPCVRFMIRAMMAWACSQGFLSPLMEEVRPPRLRFASSSRLLPPTPHFVLRWGGAFQVLGVAPYFLYQAAHEGPARLLGGCPPLSFWLDDAPPPRPCIPCSVCTR